MPDPILLLKAALAAAALAAAALLLFAWPWRSGHSMRTSAGWVLGVEAGYVLGCWLLESMSSWPPNQRRLLFFLVPAVALVEILAALCPRPRWLPWLLRLPVAAGAARLLLHGTTFLADREGPGTPGEWTTGEAWLILGGLAAALAAGWFLLVWLANRTPSRALPVTLALACFGAGVTIMYSGYTSGGQLGFPLAGALAGAAVASLLLTGPPGLRAVVGPGVVGLFALLVMGRYLGQLTTVNAALLFAAPLLGWLPELLPLRRKWPWTRDLLWVIVVAVPVAFVVVQAREKFLEDSQAASGSREGSVEDYESYGR